MLMQRGNMLKIYVGRNLMSNRLKEKDKHKWWLTNKIQSYCKGGFHHKQAPNGSQAFPPGSSVWLRHLLSLRTSGRCNARMSTPRAEVAFSSSSSGDLVWQCWGAVRWRGNCRHGAEETHIIEMSTPTGLNTSCVDQASPLPWRLLSCRGSEAAE